MRIKISGLALRWGVSPRTGGLFQGLSAAWLAGVTAAALSFKDFNGVIPEDQVELPVEGHRG